jgi:hypothetical protein
MRSKKRSQGQKPYPESLIRSRKRLALQHAEQVRVTVQAMVLRGVDSSDITVCAVAKESGVSVVSPSSPRRVGASKSRGPCFSKRSALCEAGNAQTSTGSDTTQENTAGIPTSSCLS